MWKEEPTLSRYSPATMEHELNIAFHYASRLRRWFTWLDCDYDIQKSDLGCKRPDIVFHVRGVHEFNLLIIEVKRKGDVKGGQDDLKKIHANWFSAPYLYQYGASVVFNEADKTAKLRVIQKGAENTLDAYTSSTEYSDIPPPSDAEIVKQCRELGEKLYESVHAPDAASVRRLSEELRKCLPKLYS